MSILFFILAAMPDFDEKARALAQAPFHDQAPAQILQSVDYDAFGKIHFRRDRMLFAHRSAPVELLHLARYFQRTVKIFTPEKEIRDDGRFFSFDDTALARRLAAISGFAGFRFMNPGTPPSDWLVFSGASYFRSAGALNQYGLSARGVAIDTALPSAEEFPRFTEFSIDEPAGAPIAINALLDGPSLTGAFHFSVVHSAGVVMTVEATLYARTDIARLGIAPLTSMFWYSETNHRVAKDWRPEIHDSDGLALWTGAGERLWRPLNDPLQVMTSSFVDHSPHGFGLLQRDREFSDYQDDGVFYERRPSVWVEPLSDFGAGAVQLVEIPTTDETEDNIVAYWVSAQPVKKGDVVRVRYKLHWLADEPYPAPLARVVATRIGRGGVPGQPRPQDAKKFVVDFAGGGLASLHEKIEPVVTLSRGTVVHAYALPIAGTTRWRAVFDVDAPGNAPIEMRLFLRHEHAALSETWLYQYLPFHF